MQIVKKYFRLIAAFVILPMAIFFSLYTLESKGFFKIDHIDIVVNSTESQKNFVTPKAKQLEASLSGLKGTSLWKASINDISKTLKKEAWIKEFQVSRAWPSGVEIQINPDEVSILVQAPSSKSVSLEDASSFFPVTKSAKVLNKVKSNQAPNAIVSRDSAIVNNKNIREGAVQVIESLPKSGSLSLDKVSEIGFDPKEGYWLKLLRSDMKLNYGEDQFDIKSARLSQVIDYLEKRNLKARVIDANLSKKVLVRLQQNP